MIEKYNQKIERERDLLLSDKIDAVDYRESKTEAERNLNRLEVKLLDLSENQSKIGSVDHLLKDALCSQSHLDILYRES